MNFSVISSNLSSKATKIDVTKKICNALIIPQLLESYLDDIHEEVFNLCSQARFDLDRKSNINNLQFKIASKSV